MNRRQLYEAFHRKSSPQVRVIGEKNFTYRNLLKILNKYLEEGRRTLDIGCGSGAVSLYLASKGLRVLGIDVSKNSIWVCEVGANQLNLGNRASFKVMDFPIQGPDDRFDFVICSEVLEHIENDRNALKRVCDLLNPRGILVVSVPSLNAPLYRWGLASNFDRKVGHLRRYTLGQLLGLCEMTGFKILEMKKAEGVLRNFLFLNSIAGHLVKFIKGPISDFVALLDEITLKVFGESQLFVVAQKV